MPDFFLSLAMIDPDLCEQTVDGLWATISWKVFGTLMNPWIGSLLLSSVIWVPWLIRPLPWKRQISSFGAVLLLAYWLSASPSAIALGSGVLTRFVPSDSGGKADAIVLLGRGVGLRADRVQEAKQLWQAQRAPLIFSSGRSDAGALIWLLKKQGIPKTVLDGEPCSRTTEENARFTAEILKPQGVKRILLVTDPPHMLRSLLTFRSLGFDVIPHATQFPEKFNRRAKGLLVFREYFGLLSYGVRGRFLPREVPPDAVASVLTRSSDAPTNSSNSIH